MTFVVTLGEVGTSEIVKATKSFVHGTDPSINNDVDGSTARDDPSPRFCARSAHLSGHRGPGARSSREIMRPLLLKICALALTLGVVAFVVRASRLRAREPSATAVSTPSASPVASAVVADAGAAATPLPLDRGKYGIIGPATKADPHVMRRAAEELLNAPSGSADAP